LQAIVTRNLIQYRFDHFELDGPLAWMNKNRLVGLTELPLKAFPR